MPLVGIDDVIVFQLRITCPERVPETIEGESISYIADVTGGRVNWRWPGGNDREGRDPALGIDPELSPDERIAPGEDTDIAIGRRSVRKRAFLYPFADRPLRRERYIGQRLGDGLLGRDVQRRAELIRGSGELDTEFEPDTIDRAVPPARRPTRLLCRFGRERERRDRALI